MLKIQGIPFIQGQVVLEPMQLVVIAISLILIAVTMHVVLTRVRDFWKVPVQKTTGTIQEKVFLPPYFSDDEISIHGKSGMRVYNKAEYRIKIKLSLDGKPSIGVMVKQDVFDAIGEGGQLAVSYKKGRNTGELRILEVSLA